MIKIKQIQGFTSFDFLSIVFTLTVISFVTIPILTKTFRTNEFDVAQRDLQNLSITLLKPSMENSKNLRNIASDSHWQGQIGKDPWGNTRAGFTATTKVNRKDFGLKWNKALESGQLLVGDEVEITLEVEGVVKS